MIKHLTITNKLVLKHDQYSNVNLYLWLNYWRLNLDYCAVSVDKEFGDGLQVINYTIPKLINTYNHVGFSRQSWYAGGGSSFPTTWVVNDENAAAFMPYQTFDRLMEFINTLPKKSREPYTRIYCYIFFNDAYFRHEFQRAQPLMAIELGMDYAWFNRALNKLIAAGLVSCSGKYKFTGDACFSRKYAVFDTDRCKEIF